MKTLPVTVDHLEQEQNGKEQQPLSAAIILSPSAR